MRNIVLLIVSVLMIVPVAVAQRNASNDVWASLLPPAKDRQLVLDSCTNCHNLKGVVELRRSRADWTKTVGDMVGRGAPLFPEEVDLIIAYLAKSFGPDVPKLVNVNTATRLELEKLPNMKPEIVTKLLKARGDAGSFKNPEELRKALEMEKEDFEKIRYLLKYSNG